jgi:uncharacterized protein YjbI with pentapeptide repeats
VEQQQKLSDESLQAILARHREWLEAYPGPRQPHLDDRERAYLVKGDEERQASLAGANLGGLNLVGENLAGALLAGADFGPSADATDGRRANLERANLRGADLRGARLERTSLRWADLQGADLRDANLQGADLKGANFAGADLCRARFDDNASPGTGDLAEAAFFNADLTEATLGNTTGLAVSALAGSVLTDAKLPDTVKKFDGLERVAEISKSATVAFIGMLAACGYSWLTIATTSDPRLITNSSTSPLPIAGTDVPIVGFYWAAPLVVLGAYLYVHLYLQRLWQALSKLPAVFPDGLALDEKAYPWLLTGLVRAHFVRLRDDRPFASRVENLLTILIAWWIVPATLAAFWIRYLPRHHWAGTLLHVVLLMAAVWAAMGFYSLMKRTLQGYDLLREKRRRDPKAADGVAKAGWWETRPRVPRLQKAEATALAVAVVLIALGAIEGGPSKPPEPGAIERRLSEPQHPEPARWDIRTLVADGFRLLGWRTHAELTDADLSVKPPGWTGLPDSGWEKELFRVRGASLAGADLRHARASGTFLIKAELEGADLSSADFSGADLRHAWLFGARLADADLRFADLRGAVLLGADFSGTNLSLARFDKHNTLFGIKLDGAILARADLTDVDLADVDLTGVKALTKAQVEAACFGRAPPKLPAALGEVRLKPCFDSSPSRSSAIDE